MTDKVYIAVSLTLLLCVFVLLFFTCFNLLALSEYELGVIDAWAVTTRYNRWQVPMLWFHVFATLLCLAPPTTSPLAFVFQALVALISSYRAYKGRLALRPQRLTADIPRAKRDAIVKLLLYIGSLIATVAVILRAPQPPRLLPPV